MGRVTSSGPAFISFADFIFHHARSLPEKPAIILPDRVVTYGMMAQGILRAEARIRALGVPPGALICISLANPIRHMIVGAALFRLGYPVVAAGHPADLLGLELPVGAILHGPGIDLIPEQLQAFVGDEWFVGEPQPLTGTAPQGFAGEQSVCLVALSSGTTGRPKAISLTVDAFNRWVMNYYSTLCLGTWERLLLLVGLNSSWGYTVAAHALFGGRTLIFAETARSSLDMISVYGVEAAVATSQQLRELVREQARSPKPLPSLRGILTGGAMLSRALLTEARATLCSSIVNLLGSTEAGGTAFASVDRLIGTEGAIGYVAPWAELQIVDVQDRMVPTGSEGIVRIRANCQGAPFPPERSAENLSFRDGWFYPGDLGRFEADGLLVLTGRTSEVINVGGLKLAPEVIEDMLRTHPAVTNVAAFGTMGEGGIEEISLAVLANRPIADSVLVDWSAERGVPVTRVFFMTEDLPKTASGKVHRDLLKQRFLGS
jgi:acyl-coenzyme A synthetase/AMP-(fatty) acid ligase